MFRVEYTDKDGFNRFALVPAETEEQAVESFHRFALDKREVQRVTPLDQNTMTPVATVTLTIEVGFSGTPEALDKWTWDELLEQAKGAAATLIVNEAKRGDVTGALAKRMRSHTRPGHGDPDTIVTVG